jgi:hypothetical protein
METRVKKKKKTLKIDKAIQSIKSKAGAIIICDFKIHYRIKITKSSMILA